MQKQEVSEFGYKLILEKHDDHFKLLDGWSQKLLLMIDYNNFKMSFDEVAFPWLVDFPLEFQIHTKYGFGFQYPIAYEDKKHILVTVYVGPKKVLIDKSVKTPVDFRLIINEN